MTRAERKEMARLREAVRDLFQIINDYTDGVDVEDRDRILLRPSRLLAKNVAKEFSRKEALS